MNKDKIKQLREERAAIYTKAAEAIEAAERNDKPLSGEQRQENDKRFDDMAVLDGRIADLQRLDAEAERSAAEQAKEQSEAERRQSRIGNASADGVPTSARTASVDDADVRDAANAFLREGRRGIEGLRPEVRNLLTTVGNGVLIPDSSRRVFDEALRHVDGVRRLGATIVSTPGNGNPIPLPVFSDDSEAEELAETATLRDGPDIGVEDKQLGAQKFSSGIIKLSYEVAQDNQFDLLAHVEKRLFERVAIKRHRSQTLKVVAAATNSVTAASADAITLDEWLSFEHSVPEQHWERAGVSMSGKVLRALRGLVGTDGQVLYKEALNGANPQVGMFGFALNPYLTTDDGVGAVAGDFQHLFIRDIDVRVQRMTELYAESDEIGYAVLVRGDAEVGDANAFAKLVFPASA